MFGTPDIARSNRQNQIFFINGRYVKDKNLTAAVDQAYKDMITSGKFGFVILNLEMNPQKLDVNVHPAKLEVRFQDENQIFKAVYHAIKNVFGKDENIENNIDNKYVLSENIVSTSKIDEKIEMKEGMTIQERINIINEMINKITPEKPIESKVVEEKLEEKPQPVVKQSSNLIEDIYRSRISKSDVPQRKIDYDEEGRTIRFGNTQISSNTQEIDVSEINNKLSENLEEKKLEIEDVIQKMEEAPKVNEIDVTEENNNPENAYSVQEKDIDKTQETPPIADIKTFEVKKEITEPIKTEEIKEEKEEKSDFVTEVTEKLVEAKLNNENSTEIIDTNKVKKAISETLESNPEFEKMYKKTFGIDSDTPEEKEEVKLESESLDLNEVEYVSDVNQSLFESMEEYNKINYKFIGVAFSTYIIIEIKDEMYMIDEQAAQERVLYEEIKRNYYSGTDSQLLLIPDIIQVKTKQMDIARENLEMFKKAGFEFEEFGDNTIKLTSVPSICENMNTKKLFLELLSELNTVAVTEVEEKETKFISTLAYRITNNMEMQLDMQEIEILLEQLLKLPNPFVSHGRKAVAIKMTKYDLDRKFSRR